MATSEFMQVCKQDHVTVMGKPAPNGRYKNFHIINNNNENEFYSGKGKWSSTPLVFSSLENALRSVPRATSVLLAKEFIRSGINVQNKTKQGEYTVFYGVTFKADAGIFKSGFKCNHLKWKGFSSKIRVFDEDDTIISIINFADSNDEDE
jgi:hypothetical protein